MPEQDIINEEMTIEVGKPWERSTVGTAFRVVTPTAIVRDPEGTLHIRWDTDTGPKGFQFRIGEEHESWETVTKVTVTRKDRDLTMRIAEFCSSYRRSEPLFPTYRVVVDHFKTEGLPEVVVLDAISNGMKKGIFHRGIQGLSFQISNRDPFFQIRDSDLPLQLGFMVPEYIICFTKEYSYLYRRHG